MKTLFSAAMKNFFRTQLLQTRNALNLTQAQMAAKLLMAERSYAALESGESSCGALTLALFLAFCCNDSLDFIVRLRNAFEGVLDRAA